MRQTKYSIWIIAVLIGSALTGAVRAEGAKGGMDTFGPYQVVPNWLKPVRAGYRERGCSVFVDSPNRIFFLSDLEYRIPRSAVDPRLVGMNPPPPAPPPEHVPRLMILDANGNVIDEWKQWEHLLNMPHEVEISPYDPERSVWVVDRDNSQVFKFSNDGKKLLMTLGEKGVIASDATHFGRPANISFAPDGSFYVADGYANTRIIKFDKNGKRLLTWGTEGPGPGQFKVQVHDVAIDQQGRVYVADRGNQRIEIFDSNGKYLDEWDNIYYPTSIYITKDGYVWVLSGQGDRLLKYDMSGHLLTYWGTHGTTGDYFDDPHAISLDAAGNLYVANYSTQDIGVLKLVPEPNAERSRLVSPGFNRFLP
jgi:DNA-binding beta-propeller fold protein YncE